MDYRETEDLPVPQAGESVAVNELLKKGTKQPQGMRSNGYSNAQRLQGHE